MPWVPTTDFEEEIVNLQPDHDFIYGSLSEPECSYPRPKSHTDYAVHNKMKYKTSREEFEETGKINDHLHLIQQVQRMAKTKPIGELPCINDWDDNKTIEQETIGLMRHYGMGVSIERPLDEKVTVASYPIQNDIKVVKNGGRKVTLFLDENVFKLRRKVSDASSGFESGNNESNMFENGRNDSFSSTPENSSSFDTVLSLSSNLLNTRKYENFLNSVSSLSLDSSKNSSSSFKPNFSHFETTKEDFVWTPVFKDENICTNKESWPTLYQVKSARRTKNNKKNNVVSQTHSYPNCIISDESNSGTYVESVSFLDRFLKSDDNKSKSIENSDSSKPASYASIIKATKKQPQLDFKKNSPPLCITKKKMNTLIRNAK